MRWGEINEGVGKIVKGVNTTCDVGVNQTSIEAAKLGFDVDENGVPTAKLFESKLDEKWTQNYKDRGIFDVLADFEKHGGHYATGTFGSVFIHPRWSFVYKIFNDDCYLRFARWAMRNQHPALPRFLTKPKRVVPFYKRHKKEDTVYVVKLEKLNEWQYPREELIDLGGFNYLMEHLGMSGDTYQGDTPPERLTQMGGSKHHVSFWHHVKAFLTKYPEIAALADFYPTLMAAPMECAADIHVGNVMQRDDGTLVFTDPFWHGETPYTLAAKHHQAEYGDLADPDEDEYEKEMVRGGERYRAPKKPKPRLGVEFGGYDGGDDIPF